MKTLSVRNRSIEVNGNGTKNLLPVMARRFKNNGYTHIKNNEVVYNASLVSNMVWIDEPLTL